MAVRNYTIEYDSVNCKVIKWTGLTQATTDTGQPYTLSGKYADKCIHVFGTLGVGGKLAIQGSNEATPANWVVVSDQAGTALEVTAVPKVKQVLENTLQIRPAVTAGDGTTTFSCLLVVRK
jgi:hypothetical protein